MDLLCRRPVILHGRLHKYFLTLIISVGDSSKSFLPSRVPNLEFNIFILASDGLESEINSDSSHVILIELVVCEPQQETAFSD